MQRCNGGAHTDDEQDVEDARADDVAQGKVVFLLGSGHDAGGQFGEEEEQEEFSEEFKREISKLIPVKNIFLTETIW